MYFGEMPSCINWFKVGVRLRYKKSARKPSSDMRIVVGANSEVPFDIKVGRALLSLGVERRYAAARRTTNRIVMAVYMHTRRHNFVLRACGFCQPSQRMQGCDLPFFATE